MSAGSLSQSRQVQRILDSCRRQILQHTLLVGCATLLITVTAGLLAAGLLDYLLGLPGWVRALTLTGFVTTVGFVTWKFLIQPLWSAIPLNQLGAVIDISCPELNESLATLISIQRPEATSSETGSVLMQNRLQQQISERLGRISGEQFVDSHSLLKRCAIAAACVVLVLLPMLLWPGGSRLLMQRMLNPFANLATATNLYFEVADGNRTVARGSTVTIAAKPNWRTGSVGDRPELVQVELIAASGQTESLNMMFDETSGSFVIDLARISDSVQFRVYGGGATTELFSITVVDAPQVTAAVMTVTPPGYTGRPIDRFDGMIGNMTVFDRSRLEVLLEFNKPVESAAFVWSRRDARPATDTQLFDRQFDNLTGEEIVTEEDLLNMDPDAPLRPEEEPLHNRVEAVLSQDRMSAVFDMVADVGGDFEFEVLDEHKLPNSVEPERMISVLYDKPPELKVSGLRDGDRFRPDDVLPLNCIARDDIGVGLLELHVTRNGDVAKITPATDFDRGSPEVRTAFRLVLADLGVVENDRVTVRVRTADERPEPGPQFVWSEEFTIVIDRDAEAAGARALEKQTREMIESLKMIEEQLRRDTEKANELEKRTDREWTDESREEAEALSEKEQQQGRLLEQLAKEVATHPMMKDSGEKLNELSAEVREELPEQLDKAVDGDRQAASEALNESIEKFEQVRRELHQEIEKIEEVAKLEQKLAELNRLALDAEQLAKDSKQLDNDRRKPEEKPEDVDQQQWNQELDQRQQELSQEREELSDDLERLIREEKELLEAAQRAQREQLEEIAKEAVELARREDKVADGVNEEAQEAAGAARQIANDLQAAKQKAEQVKQQRAEQQPSKPGMPDESTDLQPLDEAIKDLRQGNLARPQQNVEDVAAELAKDEHSAEVAQDLNDISDRIKQLRQERNANRNSEAAQPQQPGEQQPGEQQPGEQQPSEQAANEQAVRDLLQRAEQLAKATQAAAEAIASDPETNDKARTDAQKAADNALAASEEADAGKFSQAANELRDAARSAGESSSQMQDQRPQQEDLPGQMEGLRDELNRMAGVMQGMQQDNNSQSTAQQQTQQDIAKQAADLPNKLREVADRMAMDALEMQQESQQANNAQQVAEQAQQSTQKTSQALQQGQLQQAGKSGEQAANELQRIADLAQAASRQPGEGQARIPSEVGESVADALQDLQQAAKAMQQSAEPQPPSDAGEQAEQPGRAEQGQPADGDQSAAAEGPPGQKGQPGQQQQPGQEGQPAEQAQDGQEQSGQGQQGKPSGSQQLNAAAKALAQAAKDALPGQFDPSQMPDSGDPSQAGRDAMGNAALWDGRNANESARAANSRDWGQQNEELETETSDTAPVSRDNEYQALIRMYFREVARATANQNDE